MKKVWKWIFKEPTSPKTIFRIIVWWELRRIPYNIFIGITGFIGLALFYYFADVSGAIKPGEDLIEPLLLLISPILVNLAYTGGWVGEIVLLRMWGEKATNIAPLLLKLGVTISLFVVLFPAMVWGVALLLQLVGII